MCIRDSNWTVFEPIPWMNPDNASNYNNDPLCAIFDLGAQKSITGVSTASLVTQQIKQSANLQIYVSNDKLDWFEVSKKNGYDQQEPVNGVVGTVLGCGYGQGEGSCRCHRGICPVCEGRLFFGFSRCAQPAGGVGRN